MTVCTHTRCFIKKGNKEKKKKNIKEIDGKVKLGGVRKDRKKVKQDYRKQKLWEIMSRKTTLKKGIVGCDNGYQPGQQKWRREFKFRFGLFMFTLA